jgi:hypothetical protein
MGNILGISVDDELEKLDLPNHILNKLHNHGLSTINDIVVHCEREILTIEGIGQKSLNVIKGLLSEHGFSIAEDLYSPNICARHNLPRNDASLKTFYLCEQCAKDFQDLALDNKEPAFKQRIAGGPYYCTNCNEKRELSIYQWLLCDVCERVLRSLGRGVAASKGVLKWWERERNIDSSLPIISDTDPPVPRARAELTTNPQLDFMWYNTNGEILFGAEVKTGRNHLRGGSIRSRMTEFQLDVSDIQTVIKAMKTSDGFTPAYLFHCQVVDVAKPPTMKFVCVGIWWTSIKDLINSINEIKKRPRENRPAAYIDTRCFKIIASFVEEVATEGYRSCSRPHSLQKQLDLLLKD